MRHSVPFHLNMSVLLNNEYAAVAEVKYCKETKYFKSLNRISPA
jgi:hypothetical protein